jgi:16S rRNA (cytidine1402-2'-O)-methyltransferase
MSRLSVVPTPVGNLEDITLRALNVLKNCSLILAEDTRTTSHLLKHYSITTPMQSHHKFNEHKTVQQLSDRILAGEHLALVSDAGTPGISDPGFLLVRQCVNAGIEVDCLPGATAFVPALVVSGLPDDRFYFEGFLPVKKGRQTRLTELAALSVTFIVYESPYRVLKTLMQLSEVCGKDRPASVSREISKKFEQTIRGTLDELVTFFQQKEPKGEFVLIVGGKEK